MIREEAAGGKRKREEGRTKKKDGKDAEREGAAGGGRIYGSHFFVLFFFSSVLPAWFMNMRRVKLFGPVGGGLGKPSRCARWRDCEPTLPAPARDAERRSGFGV